ncbi:MAG: hypothetical protein ACLR6B_08955 [Blautia sp.]
MTGQLHIGDVEIEKEIEIDKEKDNKYICPEMNSGQPQPKVETGASCGEQDEGGDRAILFTG